MIATFVRALSGLLLIPFFTVADPASAEPAKLIDVVHLNIYGATVRLARDHHVPGQQIARVASRLTPGEDWSSGMAVPLPIELKSGERVNGLFWARAERRTAVPVTLQAGAPAYTSFATTVAHLTPVWQRFVISGVAPSDFPAGSQALTIQLGKVQTEVSLGPVIITPDKPDEAQIKSVLSSFQPPAVAEDVSIPSDAGVVLAGTLWTPGRASGRLPTVLLLGGSGPGQRGGVTPFTERLLGDGIAVLEYDKRGIGQSTGQFVDTLKNMETDAAAAVTYLRTRPDIDPRRIALVGHSQGGAVAPAVAAEDRDIAAVLMFAGPVAPPVPPGPGHEINLVILKDALARAGANAAAIRQVSDAAERLFEAETRNGPEAEIVPLREAVVEGFIACKFSRPQAQGALATLNSIVLEAFNAHFAPTLAKVRAPVLALFGSADVHVETSRNMPAAKAALGGNADATVIEIADVDHWFRHVKNVSQLEKSYVGSIAAPEVIKLAGDWLDARLRPARWLMRKRTEG